MAEHTFSDLEQNFDLTRFQRNLDTREVMTGKYFWHFSFIYIASDQKFEPFIITNSYSDIFYRPAEIQLHILKNFSGVRTIEIENWNLEPLLERYRNKVFNGLEQLNNQVNDFLFAHPQDFKLVDPTTADFLELDFIDNKQPYLPTPSHAFKRILDSANYHYQENTVFSDLKYIKPGLVHKLNTMMNEVIKAEAFFYSVSYLQDFVKTSRQEFNPQIFVDGPTEALQSAIKLEPEIIKYSVPQLSYLIRLKYVDQKENPLNEEALKKTITRYQSRYDG